MRAIEVTHHGAPDVMKVSVLPDPMPRDDEVVVENAAIGINFTDVHQRRGSHHYGLDSAFVPGSEGAGTVVAIGPNVDETSVGDRVAYWQPGCGAYAELVAVRSARTVPIPDNVEATTAAALLVQGLTAHYLATDTYNTGPDSVVVVHAGAGGVGLLLTQLVVNRGGAVVATSSQPSKWNIMRENGASYVSDYVDFVEVVLEVTEGRGADVVYDGVGAATFDLGLTALRKRGLMVLFGATSGPVPAFDLLRLYSEGSIYVTHPTLGDYIATRSQLLRRWRDLMEALSSGHLNVRIGGVRELDDVVMAHVDLESRLTTGKLLLVP